ncbi:unnamed protein product [Aureobasidium vineae]|uniref:Uncharacterized protein n=1 Tax=Aureobasidium vineae TaxID=2773715 RepID=A0A9N8JXF4_9PEZI|nr:unnamed protein product [Aureobasidium vineae]
MASRSSPTISNFTDEPWETATIIGETYEDEYLVRKHISSTGELANKKMQSRLRTDHVLRRKIIVGACVGSVLFLALLGFGISMFAA